MAHHNESKPKDAAPEEVPFEAAVADRFPPGKGARRVKRRRRMSLPFRIFLALVGTALVAALAAYLYYNAWLANPANVRNFAASKIGIFFPGKKVAVGSASFRIFGGLDLYDVTVSEKDRPVAVARLDHAHIDFDLKKLRGGSLRPKNISARGLFIDLVRYADGRWNLPIFLSTAVSPGQSQLSLPFGITLYDAFVSFDDRMKSYSVSFPVDSVIAMTDPQNVAMWHMSATFGGALLGKWRINARGDADAHVTESQFAVTDIDLGQGLENRMPPAARNVYRKFSPSGIADVKGSFSYSPDAGWGFDVKGALKGCRMAYYRFPVPVSDVTGIVALNTAGFKFVNLKGEIPPGTVTISGEGGFGPDDAVSISAVSTGVVLDQGLVAAFPPRVSEALRRFEPSGPMDAVTRFDRESGPDKHVEIAVDCTAEGMNVKYDLFPVAIRDVRGRISFAHGNVYVQDVTAARGAARLRVDGECLDVLHDARIAMRVDAAGIDLDEEVRRALPPKGAGVWQSLSIAGAADVAVAVSRKPGSHAAVSFTAALRGVSANYEKFPYAVSDGTGDIVFGDGLFTFSNLQFRRGAARVAVSGRADISTDEMALAFKVNGLPIDSDLYHAIPEALRARFSRLALAGVADAEFSVSRARDGAVSYSGVKASVTKGQFLEPTVPLGVGDASASVGYSENALTIRDLKGKAFADNASLVLPVVRLAQLALAPSEAALDARIDFGDEPGWEARFQTHRLPIGDAFRQKMPAGVRKILADKDVQGFADVSGSISRTGGASAPRVDYDLSVRSYQSAATIYKRLDNLAGDVKLTGSWEGGVTALRTVARLSGLDFDGKHLGQTSFTVATDAREAVLESFSTNALGGVIRGQGRIDATSTAGCAFIIDFDAVSLNELVAQGFGYAAHDLSGKVKGRLELLSRGSRAGDFIGSAQATVTDGTLWQVPLVLALMNVINLKLPQQTQFSQAHIRCNIAAGKLLVDEFSMSSDPATILGKGVIGLDGTLDLTFYSRPGKIPIVSLIAGEVGRQIVKARATGTFGKPVVVLEPSGAVGGMLDWLKKRFTR